jgi:hypothetical protein
MNLARVPHFDARDGGPAAHARARVAQALAVRDACLGWVPAGGALARVGDPLVRRWMRRSASPYVEDIAAVQARLGRAGAWTLHGAYLFGCTALADEGAAGPRLRRTLDWPFPGLGRLAETVWQRGPAGDFVNVTWPGFVGVLTAMAPGRFAASINQAPMPRRTAADALRWIDYARNAMRPLWSRDTWPPEHLLRHAFETCATFDEAKALLERAPLARAVLFMLVGTKAGERVVIEREETAFRTRLADDAIANAWRDAREGWEPRVCGVGRPAENNARRIAALSAWSGRDAPAFDWVAPPVRNAFTRLSVDMAPASGSLGVMGWEPDAVGDAAPVSVGGFGSSAIDGRA